MKIKYLHLLVPQGLFSNRFNWHYNTNSTSSHFAKEIEFQASSLKEDSVQTDLRLRLASQYNSENRQKRKTTVYETCEIQCHEYKSIAGNLFTFKYPRSLPIYINKLRWNRMFRIKTKVFQGQSLQIKFSERVNVWNIFEIYISRKEPHFLTEVGNERKITHKTRSRIRVSFWRN